MNKRYTLVLLWLTATNICSATDRGWTPHPGPQRGTQPQREIQPPAEAPTRLHTTPPAHPQPNSQLPPPAQPQPPSPAHDSTPTKISVTATVGDGIIILDWKVAMEHNTVRYEILRATDTTAHYTVVGKVRVAALRPGPGSGSIGNIANTIDSLSYSFTDLPARPNITYYYRLHQIGKDKQSAYSAIVSATASDPGQKINIFPNPANTFIYVSNIGGQGVLRIYDQSGRIVLETALDGDQQQINISTLKTGSYYARIDREGKVQYQQTLIIN